MDRSVCPRWGRLAAGSSSPWTRRATLNLTLTLTLALTLTLTLALSHSPSPSPTPTPTPTPKPLDQARTRRKIGSRAQYAWPSNPNPLAALAPLAP